ncbi:MAG: polyprenyl synthetase family protein [Candidatus Marinimicrobia bacterium]|nr:polyprenyl synthetase family protein [Candidatus Neomarinimicrobiota bacterium]
MANSNLKKIIEPIKDDLDKFQVEFVSALQSDVKLINTVSKYIIQRRGKRFRPILTILAAHICGKPTENTYRAAAVMELLHIATLIHDDIVDDAEYRRSWPSINRVWKNKISLLMGDYVLSKSLIYMVKMKNFKVLDSIGRTAEDLSSGELLQIEKSINKRMDENVYYKMIEKKTASLIATACELGAITSSENEADHETLKIFGNNLGIAFQIKDDLFDLLGNESDTGKDLAQDVISNMITLPIVHSMNTAEKQTVRQIGRLLRKVKKEKKVTEELKSIIESTGGFDYAKNKITEFSDKALLALDKYPDTVYKQKLIDLVNYNGNRKK